MGDEMEHRSIAVGVIGPGLVGKTLLGQLAEQVSLEKASASKSLSVDDRVAQLMPNKPALQLWCPTG